MTTTSWPPDDQEFRLLHAPTCAVRDSAYCGGPCTCGLVRALTQNPIAQQRIEWEAARPSPSHRIPPAPSRQLRSTHTFAELEVSIATYDEIRGKLDAAGYSHAFVGAAIDMHGIGLVKARCAVHGEDCSGDEWPSCKTPEKVDEDDGDFRDRRGGDEFDEPAQPEHYWLAAVLGAARLYDNPSCLSHERRPRLILGQTKGVFDVQREDGKWCRVSVGPLMHQQPGRAPRVVAEQQRDALRAAGTALSNLAYNLAQLTSLDVHVRRQLDEARKAWDAQLAQGGGV